MSSVPIAGDIPILGALFKNTETERSKTELLIIATVNLVKPIETEQIVVPKIERTHTLERFFGVPFKSEQTGYANQIMKDGGFLQ